MDRDVAGFLLDLLNQTTLTVDAKSIEETAALVTRARTQLTAELEEHHDRPDSQ